MSAGVASGRGHGSLAVCLLLAALLHVAVIAGFDWPQPRIPAPAQAIDLVLRAGPADPPARAGPSRLQGAPTPRAEIEQDAATQPAPPSRPPAAADSPPPAPATPPRPSLAGRSALGLAQDVAALHARQPAAPASAERVARLDFASRASPEFAYYLEAWRRKVERVGNLNYPAEARANGISGSLRLRVVVAADGTLEDVDVLESSGKPVLDEAAVRIVELAAPFAPFTSKMAQAVDVIEIERTWRFANNRYSS